MNEILKDYIGQEFTKLPETLQKNIMNQFPKFDNEYWWFVEVHTWESFINLYKMVDWIFSIKGLWHMHLEYPVVWRQNNVCVVEIDVLDKFCFFCEHSKDDPSLTVSAAEEFAHNAYLIIDSDAPYFKKGYIVIQVYPDLKEGKLLSFDIMTKERAIEVAKDAVKQELQNPSKIIIKQNPQK